MVARGHTCDDAGDGAETRFPHSNSVADGHRFVADRLGIEDGYLSRCRLSNPSDTYERRRWPPQCSSGEGILPSSTVIAPGVQLVLFVHKFSDARRT